MTTPARMEAIALDAAGQVLARCPLEPEVDGRGQLTFELPEDAPEIARIRWTTADDVVHEYTVPPRRFAPERPSGECPTCHRDLKLDIDRDPPCTRYIPLHGGWPPCEGSGMPA